MSVRIDDKTKQYQGKTKQQASLFLRQVTEEIIRQAEPKTPKKTGQLRRNIFKQVIGLKGKVVWNQRYAAYQEDIQHLNYTTPGTGPHFAERAVKNVTANTDVIAKRVFK